MDNQNLNTETNLYANPAIPPAAPKKSNGVVIGLVIAIVVIVLALGGVVGVAAYNMFVNSPEARLAKGFAKWGGTTEDENTVSEVLGWSEISDSMLYGATQKDMSLNVTFPIVDIPTIGVDMVDTCDYPNQKDLSDWKLSVSNIELLNFRIGVDAEKLYLAVPTLLESTYHIGLENFTENFNNSAWSKMIELTLEETVELNPWIEKEETSAEEVEETLVFSEEFMAEFEAKIEELSKSITIEETDTVIEVTRNGKTVKCDGIHVVAPKEDLNELFDMLLEEMRNGEFGQEMIRQLEEKGIVDVQETWDEMLSIFDSKFVADFQLMFYLDKKNNIVHMATPEMVAMDNGVAVGFSMDFVGEENPAEVVNGLYKIVLEEEGVALSMDFICSNEKDETKASTNFDMKIIVEEFGLDPEEAVVNYEYNWDSETLEFSMSTDIDADGETLFGFVMEGKFADVVKSESFAMELGKFIVNVEGENLMKVTGDFAVKPLTEEVKMPSESVDFLGMTEMDIQMLLFEIIGNADKMTDALDEFDF